MSGIIKGQHTTSILGKYPVMGSLTDEQIREHYKMQARDGFGKQALEELSRTEKKPIDEIRRICGLGERKAEQVPKLKYSQQIKEAVIRDRSAGVPSKQIAEEQGLSVKQVENIYTCYKKKLHSGGSEEVAKEKHPEAYPGQIYDDPVKPEEVTEPKITPIRPLNGFAALLAMQEFVSTIAEGGEIMEAAAAGSDAHISFSFGGVNYGLELKLLGN